MSTTHGWTVENESPPELWRRAVQAWCKAHGIDPNDVPLYSTFEIDDEANTITYSAYVRDENTGRIRWDKVTESAVEETRTVQMVSGMHPFPSLESFRWAANHEAALGAEQ